jgi:hypothetical protein
MLPAGLSAPTGPRLGSSLITHPFKLYAAAWSAYAVPALFIRKQRNRWRKWTVVFELKHVMPLFINISLLLSR